MKKQNQQSKRKFSLKMWECRKLNNSNPTALHIFDSILQASMAIICTHNTHVRKQNVVRQLPTMWHKKSMKKTIIYF